MNVDERIQMLAANQHGVVARRQLREQGITWSALRSRIAKDLLLAHGPHSLIVAGSPPTWKQELMVAMVDAGPEAAVSHESAAALLRLPGYWPSPIEISRPRGTTAGVAHGG